MSFTRRQFLLSSGATAIIASLGAALIKRSGRSLVRYCVPSPELEDLNDYGNAQDFNWVATVKAPKIAGVPDGFRSLLTIIDHGGGIPLRAFVPGLVHSGRFFGNRIALITRGKPSVLFALDASSLEILSVLFPPNGYVFGGHLIPYLDGNTIALTLNSEEFGQYDAVGIYDLNGWREMDRFSSFGFQAHDLTLSPDQKRLYVGHYGSNFKSGPYNKLKVSPIDLAKDKNTPYLKNGIVFPGSVSVVDPLSGRMLERKSDEKNGPQGHIAVSQRGQIFLSKNPPLLNSRPDVIRNLAFAEGDQNKNHFSDFYMTSPISGTTIITDQKYEQFLLPITKHGKIVYGEFSRPDFVRSYDLMRFGDFGMPHSIQLHPDGVHYIVSCERGFAAFTRGTHVFDSKMSFGIKLANHSHFCIG